jgi:hypothetical protein
MTLIVVLGTQRSFSSITMQLLEAHGVQCDIDYTYSNNHCTVLGRYKTNYELNSLYELGRHVFYNFFPFHYTENISKEESNILTKYVNSGTTRAYLSKATCDEHLLQAKDLLTATLEYPVAALKFPGMLPTWHFWGRIIKQHIEDRDPQSVLPIMIRNPYDIAQSYAKHFARRYDHLHIPNYTDVYGTLYAYLKKQLEIAEHVPNAIPIRVTKLYYEKDMERLVNRVGLQWQPAIFKEHFKPTNTFDTNTGQASAHAVFQTYRKLMDWANFVGV